MPGIEVVVFSRTLPAAEYPGVHILNDDPTKIVAELKKQKGKDIWLFGGGVLFRTLLDAGLVDTVEVCVSPVLLGEGIPLLPPGSATELVLSDQKTLTASGNIALAYSISGSSGAPPRIGYVKAAAKSQRKKSTRKVPQRTAAKKQGNKKLAGKNRPAKRELAAPRNHVAADSTPRDPFGSI
jgi:hypothetical protein